MPRSFREKEQGDLGIQKAGWVRAWRAREEARRANSGSPLEGGGWRAHGLPRRQRAPSRAPDLPPGGRAGPGPG